MFLIKLCEQAGKKFNALARLSSFINLTHRKILLEIFINSHFWYYPLKWMFCKWKTDSRINHLHEQALRIVYVYKKGIFHLMISWEKTVILQYTTGHLDIINRAFQSKNSLPSEITSNIFEKRQIVKPLTTAWII